MSTDADKPLNGATEPFRRPVIWGRPPQTVFRAGPLPKGERLPPLPEPPRESQVRPPRAVGQGILSGSMIPRAAPRPAPQALTTETPVVPPPEARPEPAPRPVPTLHASDPDLTVRPLPPLEPGPTKPVAALQLEALPAFQPAVRDEPEPARAPAPAAFRTERAAPGRKLLYGGVAAGAVAVLALGGWMLTRPPADAPVPAGSASPPAVETAVAPPAASPPTVVATPTPEPAPRLEPVTPIPAPARLAPARIPAPTPVRETSPAATRPAQPPPAEAPAPTIAPAPLIEIAPAPPAGPPPTEAERPSADPDAPIATRPQPIG